MDKIYNKTTPVLKVVKSKYVQRNIFIKIHTVSWIQNGLNAIRKGSIKGKRRDWNILTA